MNELIEKEMERTGLNEMDFEEHIFLMEDSDYDHKRKLLNSDKYFLEWLEEKPDKKSYIQEVFENIYKPMLMRKQ